LSSAEMTPMLLAVEATLTALVVLEWALAGLVLPGLDLTWPSAVRFWGPATAPGPATAAAMVSVGSLRRTAWSSFTLRGAPPLLASLAVGVKTSDEELVIVESWESGATARCCGRGGARLVVVTVVVSAIGIVVERVVVLAWDAGLCGACAGSRGAAASAEEAMETWLEGGSVCASGVSRASVDGGATPPGRTGSI
jgi:hypothetical protein